MGEMVVYSLSGKLFLFYMDPEDRLEYRLVYIRKDRILYCGRSLQG